MINNLVNIVIGLVSSVISFIQYFISKMQTQPFWLVLVVVLLFATKKGGLKVGKALEVSAGK